MKQDVLKRVFDYIEDHLNEEISQLYREVRT